MTHGVGSFRELHLGRVLSTDDPERRGRIEVEMAATGLRLWAPCLTLGAGNGYGVSMLPRTDEIVALAFAGPDEDNAIVLGAVWSGDSAHPEAARLVDDVYAIVTPAGVKVKIDDGNGPRVDIETPSGAHLTVTDDGGGEITLERGGESISMTASTISIVSSATVEVQATQVDVSAAMVNVDAAMSQFSGVVKCDTLIATSVVGTSYTPGAGNVW